MFETTITALVDAFVDKVNRGRREPQPLIRIGNPFFYNYDPVCFDCNPPLPAGRKLRSTGYHEYRIVTVDHEAVLCRNEIRIVEDIAPSFIAYMRRRIASDPIVRDRQ